MDSNFGACFSATMQFEGGDRYTNYPNDPGGPTKWGVTLATLRSWRRNDLLTAWDVKNLTETDAQAIYGARYFNPVRGPSLPVGVDFVTTDFAFNAGPYRSALELQVALGFTSDDLDGSIGPETLGAVTAANIGKLVASITAAHDAWYKTRPQYYLDGKGWLSRAAQASEVAAKMIAGEPKPVAINVAPLESDIAKLRTDINSA